MLIPVARRRPGVAVREEPRQGGLASGVGCCVVIAAVATVVGRWLPVVGAPVVAIVLGVLCSGLVRGRSQLTPGIAFAAGRVLQGAVVLLGVQLSLRQVWQVGASSLPVMLCTLVACLVVAWLVGRWLRIGPDLRTLIGVGTAICGASAIAAVSPVIRAKSSDIAYAVPTIFLFNVAAVLTFSAVGHVVGLSQHAFGLFAGTAVNDTSSVVAASASYGHAASEYAIVVKLTRTLMIVPITVGLAAITARHEARVPDGPGPVRITKLVPWFLVGFLIAATVNSLGWVPAAAHAPLQTVSVFLITVALAGIGLATDPRAIRGAGPRPLMLGAVLWVVVTTTSLLVQAVTR